MSPDLKGPFDLFKPNSDLSQITPSEATEAIFALVSYEDPETWEDSTISIVEVFLKHWLEARTQAKLTQAFKDFLKRQIEANRMG